MMVLLLRASHVRQAIQHGLCSCSTGQIGGHRCSYAKSGDHRVDPNRPDHLGPVDSGLCQRRDCGNGEVGVLEVQGCQRSAEEKGPPGLEPVDRSHPGGEFRIRLLAVPHSLHASTMKSTPIAV